MHDADDLDPVTALEGLEISKDRMLLGVARILRDRHVAKGKHDLAAMWQARALAIAGVLDDERDFFTFLEDHPDGVAKIVPDDE